MGTVLINMVSETLMQISLKKKGDRFKKLRSFVCQGQPTTVFCIISGWRSKSVLPRIFYYLREAKNV